MFRKLVKNKKAQNTAEYAILISLVVAGIIAMQTYAQRALQARVRDSSLYMANAGNGALSSTQQYEPYYLESDYTTDRSQTDTLSQNSTFLGSGSDSTATRQAGGSQTSSYNAAGVITGI